MANTRDLLLSLSCTGLLLSAPLAAQFESSWPTNDALVQAVAYEELEHDATEAAKRYAKIADDEGVADAIRRHASLRLAAALARSASNDAATAKVMRRKALEMAAKGDDAIARQAQKLLDQDPADEARRSDLHRKAKQLVSLLATGGASGKDWRQLGLNSDPYEDLRWIGPPAAPAVVEWLRSSPEPNPNANDAAYAKAARAVCDVAWALGGDVVDRLLRDALADPSLRIGPTGPYREPTPLRDIALTALSRATPKRWSPTLVEVTELYLRADDFNPRMQASAALQLSDYLSTELLLAEMSDLRFEFGQMIRRTLFNRVGEMCQQAGTNDLSDAEKRALRDQLTMIAERVRTDLTPLLDRPDPLLQRDVSNYLGLLLASRSGRDWLLENLPELRLTSFYSPLDPARVQTTVVRRRGSAVAQTRVEPGDSIADSLWPQLEDANEEMAAWLKLATDVRDLEQDAPQRAAISSVANMLSLAADFRSLDTVLELQDQKLFPMLQRWLDRQEELSPDELERVVRSLGKHPRQQHDLLEWLLRREIPGSLYGPLLELDAGRDEVGSIARTNWVHALLRTGDPRAVAQFREYLKEGLAETPQWSVRMDYLDALCQMAETSTDAAPREMLRDLALAGMAGPFASATNNRVTAWRAFLFLARIGDPLLAEAITESSREAAWRQMAEGNPATGPLWELVPAELRPEGQFGLSDTVNVLIVSWPVTSGGEVWSDENGEQRSWKWHGYDRTDFAALWRKLLQGEVRNHVWDAAGGLTQPDFFDNEIAEVLIEAWERRITTRDDGQVFGISTLGHLLKQRATLPAALQQRVERLYEASFGAPSWRVRLLALKRLPRELDESARARVVAALSDPRDTVVEHAVMMLVGDDRPITRAEVELGLRSKSVRFALAELATRAAEPVADLVASIPLQHGDPELRVAACKALAALLDAAAVPALLRKLGDPEFDVRTEARKALEAIRFHQEQQAHWDAVFSGNVELGSSKAAAKLVSQAKADQPKAKRLLAIRSLGALAEPAALPFLIEWTSSEDTDIATAATTAIQQIHSKLERR